MLDQVRPVKSRQAFALCCVVVFVVLIVSLGASLADSSGRRIAVVTTFEGDVSTYLRRFIRRNDFQGVVDDGEFIFRSGDLTADSVVVGIFSDWARVADAPLLDASGELTTRLMKFTGDQNVIEGIAAAPTGGDLKLILFSLGEEKLDTADLDCISRQIIDRIAGSLPSPARIDFSTCVIIK